jgi:hypothetical protein
VPISALGKERLDSLLEWMKESVRLGLGIDELVALLVSQAVRVYRLSRPEEKSAVTLIEWVTRVFHSESSGQTAEDEWDLN